jgi:dienelactone hydrolase
MRIHPRAEVLRRTTALIAVLLTASAAWAAGPRVLPEGQLPADVRLAPAKDLNGYFPLRVPDSPEAWAHRAEQVRRQVLVSQGLWPMPEKTPANAVIHGRIERDDYTVDKVFFESWPGHFVTGNLYRPKGKTGPFAGVLCPHGHWANGRFQDWGPDEVKNLIVQGAERFAEGGRHVLQSRCVQLARMGCVVFHYDMVGYADSVQIAHRPGVRESMNTAENWGYFSPQAELRLQSMMGLQTYNSIRALDFLLEQPDVDPARIGVTGASGGGTQTFILCAVDPRPAAAFPAVMVSTAMQGGCTCENASYLRVGTGNIELAGLFAPKPLAMSGADDWTKEIMTKGLPELKRLYAMLGAPDNVMAKALVQFPHNYNYVSRAVMYGWLNRHLQLGLAEPVVEEDFDPLSIEELSVWDAAHPKPVGGDDYERSLLATITAEYDRQLAELEPRDAPSLARFHQLVGGGWDVLIGRGLPEEGSVSILPVGLNDRGDYVEYTGLVRHEVALESKDPGPLAAPPSESPPLEMGFEELPAVLLYPEKDWNGQTVIWVHEQGKAGIFESDGTPIEAVRGLLREGSAVLAADLLYQGEFTADGQPLARTSLVRTYDTEWGKYSGYTFGYNASLFARRAQDVLTLVHFARNNGVLGRTTAVHLVGQGAAATWAAAAAFQAGDAVNRLALDTAGYRFSKIAEADDPNFLPGAVRYGDVPALLKLAVAGRETWLVGESADLAKTLESLVQSEGSLVVADGTESDAAKLIAWLSRGPR